MTQADLAPQVIAALEALRTTATGSAEIGVRMGAVFDIAKAHVAMPPSAIESLLESPMYEVRVAAVSVMDFQARAKKTPKDRRRELYELYLRRHDRIDHWGMVDRAAPYVVGGYLWERSREPLYTLARSAMPMERRTAIVATYYFIRQHDLADTFAIGDILAHDPDELVQKAVGGWVREAGKQDQPQLLAFLDRHAATMPRTALRYAVEHLPPDVRARYMGTQEVTPNGRRVASPAADEPAGDYPAATTERSRAATDVTGVLESAGVRSSLP
ncbi:hypothetical protein AYO38_01245 [bacterium SCGC AG-212-C10]|nr:hypothetical protein AYO38_01245 [bacterium SCGC AG-212-C10]